MQCSAQGVVFGVQCNAQGGVRDAMQCNAQGGVRGAEREATDE